MCFLSLTPARGEGRAREASKVRGRGRLLRRAWNAHARPEPLAEQASRPAMAGVRPLPARHQDLAGTRPSPPDPRGRAQERGPKGKPAACGAPRGAVFHSDASDGVPHPPPARTRGAHRPARRERPSGPDPSRGSHAAPSRLRRRWPPDRDGPEPWSRNTPRPRGLGPPQCLCRHHPGLPQARLPGRRGLLGRGRLLDGAAEAGPRLRPLPLGPPRHELRRDPGPQCRARRGAGPRRARAPLARAAARPGP